jgi:hypothetical protein
MLPSFRLIVAAFLCGFAVVFAGLRLAVSLNDIPGALPVTAAHAALHVLPTADGEARVASVPAMFDARFAISPVPAVLVRATPSPSERPSPLLSVIPPQDSVAADAAPMAAGSEPAEQPSKPGDVLATVQPDPPADAGAAAEAAAPVTPDAPVSTNSQQ